MEFENESINNVLGMEVADWLKSRYGKSKPEERNQDIKGWLISSEGNQMMYTGKGKKPVPYDASYGMTHILAVNIQPEVPMWDVRELVSAFVPVIYVYRHKFTNKEGKLTVAQNIRITIPSNYNHKNVVNVLAEMREGEIILGGRVIYFHQYIEKEKKPAIKKATGPVITTNEVKGTPKPAEAYKGPAKVPPKAPVKPSNKFAALAPKDDDTASEHSATGGGAGTSAEQEIDDHEIAKKLALELLDEKPEEHVGGWVDAVKGKK